MITRDQLLNELRACASMRDAEDAHVRADLALVDYINDADIAEAYERVPKWYA